MPKVGDKEFSYDAEGLRAAQEHSAKTGIPMQNSQRYNVGGLVKGGGKKGKKFTTRGIGKAVTGTKTRGSV